MFEWFLTGILLNQRGGNSRNQQKWDELNQGHHRRRHRKSVSSNTTLFGGSMREMRSTAYTKPSHYLNTVILSLKNLRIDSTIQFGFTCVTVSPTNRTLARPTLENIFLRLIQRPHTQWYRVSLEVDIYEVSHWKLHNKLPFNDPTHFAWSSEDRYRNWKSTWYTRDPDA